MYAMSPSILLPTNGTNVDAKSYFIGFSKSINTQNSASSMAVVEAIKKIKIETKIVV